MSSGTPSRRLWWLPLIILLVVAPILWRASPLDWVLVGKMALAAVITLSACAGVAAVLAFVYVSRRNKQNRDA